jgi:hypothetical protein
MQAMSNSIELLLARSFLLQCNGMQGLREEEARSTHIPLVSQFLKEWPEYWVEKLMGIQQCATCTLSTAEHMVEELLVAVESCRGDSAATYSAFMNSARQAASQAELHIVPPHMVL